MIEKREVKQALKKFGIDFDFPCHTKSGETITVWSDLYNRNGNIEQLRKAILADNTCLFTISNIPANYLASLRLIRRLT